MSIADRWESWHLHVPTFESAAADRVVSWVIGPAADLVRRWKAACEGTVPVAWFFVRYWQFGPHVRFRASGLEPDQAHQIDELLRARLADVLAVTVAALTSEEYRQVADPLAAAGEGGPPLEIGDLWPEGVYRRPYQPEIERYGGARLLAQSEALFETSSELALAFLRRNPPEGARCGLGLCAVQAALDALGDLDHRRRFCRRAADGWQTWAARGGGGGPEVTVLPSRLDGRIPAPVRRWADQLMAAMSIWRDETSEEGAERILHSHIHMLHNRLGLSVARERNHYLVLAALR